MKRIVATGGVLVFLVLGVIYCSWIKSSQIVLSGFVKEKLLPPTEATEIAFAAAKQRGRFYYLSAKDLYPLYVGIKSLPHPIAVSDSRFMNEIEDWLFPASIISQIRKQVCNKDSCAGSVDLIALYNKNFYARFVNGSAKLMVPIHNAPLKKERSEQEIKIDNLFSFLILSR